MAAEKCKIDCKEMQEIKDFLFAPETGVSDRLGHKVDHTCLLKYFKKPPVWLSTIIVATFITMCGSSIATGYKVYFGQESVPLIYAEKDDVKDNATEIKLLKQSLQTIDKSIQKIEADNKEQKQEMKTGFKEIKDFMRIIMRHRGINDSKDNDNNNE